MSVATAEDPAVDDAVLAHLHQLGVRQVRVDFTYGDAANHVARLLDRLLADDFSLMLHLVQPFGAARNMLQPETQAEWRAFVVATLERFGDRIEFVEIGSTINRKRWAGYTLDGFLAMWSIAHAETRERRIKLAGPNITDFEPTYNVGILSLLKSRGELPDIHTNNLFVERCTEPERDDHKVFGHRLAALGGFRLVKKCFILQEIGTHFGVSEFVSPAAFWTLPRIQRILEDVGEKQADYIARYLLLCAASGSMRHVGWGPLICQREGLVDNGMSGYPTLERITHYASVQGDEFKAQPSFHAFSTLAQLIPGGHYEACLDDADGLEIHAFTNHGKRIHAAWVINGRAAALRDLYSEADLRRAEFTTRDGEVLREAPDFLTESPLYLSWPGGDPIKIRSSNGLVPNLVIHAHIGLKHFEYHQEGWHGVILAKNRTEAGLLATALNPQLISIPPKAGTLRKARNAVWTIPDPRDPSRKLVVKQPVKMSYYKRLVDRLKPSKALRSWNGTSELLRRGIDAAKPVAYFEHATDRSLMRNMYLCEFVESDCTVREIFSAFATGARVHQGVTDDEMYEGLSTYLCRMHERGVHFRDLSGGNILVRRKPDGCLQFLLIDTGRARFHLKKTPLFASISDLTRTCHKLQAEGRCRFMTLYMKKRKMVFKPTHRIPFHLYDLKCRLKRSLKGRFLRQRSGQRRLE